ncbi:unnamed protein product [Trichobilharzia szidati]|nr:unnamed protein product [Trichobilharzia szidati]
MTRGRRSSSADSSQERDIFFQCRGKKLSVTEVAEGESFSRFTADQLIRKHIKKGHTKITMTCSEDRLKLSKVSSIAPHSVRKSVQYKDIINFLVFTSKPGVFMLCINDSETRKKTYESFCCDEPSDLETLTRLISSAKHDPEHRLYKSYNTSRSTIDMNNDMSAADYFESATNLNSESATYQSGFLRDNGSPNTEATVQNDVFHSSSVPLSPSHTYNNLTSVNTVSMTEIPHEGASNGYTKHRTSSSNSSRGKGMSNYNSPNGMISPAGKNNDFHPLIGYQSKNQRKNSKFSNENDSDLTPMNSRNPSFRNLLRIDNENIYTRKDELIELFDNDLTFLTSSSGDVYECENGSKYLFCQSGLERLQTYEGPLFESPASSRR